MEFTELKQNIFEYGIVGAGGAGFPTHGKMSEKVDTVILNCAECEPLFRVDRQLLQQHTEEILTTLSFIVEAIGAEKGFIGIKTSYKEAARAIDNILYKYKKIEKAPLPDVYPMGDETVLVYEVTGRIVPEGAIPLAVGAMILNVETVWNLYKGIFLKQPVTEKYVTITGAVQNPITLKVPVGTRVKDLLRLAGGTTIEQYEILSGGPMTGRLIEEKEPITKTTKAIIVLPKDHSIIIRRKEKTSVNLNRIRSVCSQCQMCTDLCPRYLLGHSLKPNRIMKALGDELVSDLEAYTMSMLCCECGLCEAYACHQGLSPRKVIGELKGKLRAKGIKNPHNKVPSKVDTLREGRMVPMERLIARLGVQKYNVEAPLKEDEVEIKEVEVLLQQHVGSSTFSEIKVGEFVRRGQLLGEVPSGKLGARIHASITGEVTKADSRSIIIERRGEKNE